MRSPTQSLIHELDLVARALRLLSETIDSPRAREALVFSVESIGLIEQRMVDLDDLLRAKSAELASCRAERDRLQAGSTTAVHADRGPTA